MMRFAEDEELSAEIAHNATGHIDAKMRNAAIGAIFGALGDVAMAYYGVNTGGQYTNQFAQIAAMSFSQDFENEADYVGMYILARAGQPLERAPNIWRHMAQASPGSISLATSHPTTAERFVRMERAMAEIADKRARGEDLNPEMKADRPDG